MRSSTCGSSRDRKHVPGFVTTQWSLVVAAGNDNTSVAQDALATLYATYWYPLYAYAAFGHSCLRR